MSKNSIINSLKNFAQGDILQNSLELFSVLGYTSRRRYFTSSVEDFKDKFLQSYFDEAKIMIDDWVDIKFLFELQANDLNTNETTISIEKTIDKDIEAYWFIALELKKDNYTKKQLSDITREFNKQRPIPVFVLFKYGENITLSIIDRRINKKDNTKDVLQKIVLIKDIKINKPHRAHIEILNDISFENIKSKFKVTNFVELHLNWLKALSVSELNKKFYTELSNWFFWMIDTCQLSKSNIEKDSVMFGIRMVTRIIFNWFIKEKGLVPEKIFEKETYLDFLKPEYRNCGDLYYKVILQNLFFGCLNKPMDRREFRSQEYSNGRNKSYGVKDLYRYEKYLNNKNDLLNLYKEIPFLNGGLFECVYDADCKRSDDCFTDEDSKNFLKISDDIFFMENEKTVDLSSHFENSKKYKDAKVRGLFEILNSYKFTIDETTPIEEEIALDPELLGRVFENLLAAHNPETKTTARKSTGSYYTPREIVDYMCEQSLLSYLKNKMASYNIENIEDKLKELLSYSEAHSFNDNETNELIKAINNVKILDPACGSGAFPMGLLHKLVHILSKLDPNNEKWKQEQLRQISDPASRQEMEDKFKNNDLNYLRKIFLIQNCIFGIDIQPMATQISRLRFFISLIVDEKYDKTNKNNKGIAPLPNLETKFVTANSLVDLPFNTSFLDKEEVQLLKRKLESIKQNHFRANTRQSKKKWEEEDRNIRAQIKAYSSNLNEARILEEWSPYDKDNSVNWFNPKWMFNQEKFDIVIGNPPYLPYKKASKSCDLSKYKSFDNNQVNKPNLYVYFIENALEKLLKTNGILSFINPIAFLVQSDCAAIRKLIMRKQINELLDVSYIDIFEDADTYTVILNIQNIDNPTNFKYNRFFDLAELNDNHSRYISTIETVKKDSELKIVLSEYNDLINKITMQKDSFVKYVDIICGTSKEGFGKDIKDVQTPQNYKVLQASDIQRYQINWLGKYIEKSLYSRDKVENFFNRSKIVMARMTDSIRCALDTEQYYCAKINAIISKDKSIVTLKKILLLLNSKLYNFYYKEIYRALHKKGDALGFDIPSIEKLPITDPKNINEKTVSMVDKILELTGSSDYTYNETKQAAVKEYEDKIDLAVYKLYNLTYDEVLIVDNDFSMSKEEYNNYSIGD